MPYIIDADWFIQSLRGHSTALTILNRLGGDVIYISWVTIGEVYEVVFNTPHPQAQIASFRQSLDLFRKVDVTEPIVERFAEIRSFLRRRGQMISDFDILLAATALDRDLTVLTFNTRHFERIPDLRIYRFS